MVNASNEEIREWHLVVPIEMIRWVVLVDDRLMILSLFRSIYNIDKFQAKFQLRA